MSAVVLATVGAVLLLAYVSGADQRAQAGMVTTTVLVATAPIPNGTPAEKLTSLVTAKAFPSKAVVPGTLSSLRQIAGQVATVDLEPGEQLLASRFADPAALQGSGEVKIPAGMQQGSVVLDPQRALGGRLPVGTSVGVFISFADPTQTHLTLQNVLVVGVQGGVAPAEPKPSDAVPSTPEPAPGGSVMVTVAVNAADAEKLVFGAEHGTIWLSLEPASARPTGTRIVTGQNVYK